MTSNDVPPQNSMEEPMNNGEMGNSLKVSSSFHPVQHQKYNLWLNSQNNEDFFNKTPKYLKKMEPGKQYIPKTKGSKILRGLNRRSKKS